MPRENEGRRQSMTCCFLVHVCSRRPAPRHGPRGCGDSGPMEGGCLEHQCTTTHRANRAILNVALTSRTRVKPCFSCHGRTSVRWFTTLGPARFFSCCFVSQLRVIVHVIVQQLISNDSTPMRLTTSLQAPRSSAWQRRVLSGRDCHRFMRLAACSC